MSKSLLFQMARRGILHCAGKDLRYGERTLVMGIINVTADSFSGDGTGGQIDRAIEKANDMVRAGADLLDIGGESTRPQARPVDLVDELARVVPVIEALARWVPIPLSVDTRKSEVAEAALAAGAHIINDVTGLQDDPNVARVARAYGAPVIAMHSPGPSWQVAWPAHYQDVVADVKEYLTRSIQTAVEAGLPRDQVVVDPGFGFGKSTQDNLSILRRLSEFRELGVPVLLGTSRKSTIGKVLDLPVDDRLEGSLATLPLAIAAGVDIVRVHDVQASVRVVRMADAVVRGWNSGGN